MLGTREQAEDAVHDTYLKWHEADANAIRSIEAWLVTLVTRLCIDRLRALKIERQTYFGPWLPEPLLEADMATPEWKVELADDISIAFLRVLERLSPDERATFLLREVFDFEYAEIAAALGRREGACRQILSRAKERLREERPRFQVSKAAHVRLLQRFVEATTSGNRDNLATLFTEDAVLVADGGGQAAVVFKPLQGAGRLARLFAAIAGQVSRHNVSLTYAPAQINGEPGLLRLLDGRMHSALAFECDGERISAVYIFANPDKLRNIGTPVTSGQPHSS